MSLLTDLIPGLARNGQTERTEIAATEAGPTVKPAYEIKETPEAFAVTVFLPGVAKDGLEVTAEDGQVRILGRRAWRQPEGWTALHRETAGATYELVLTHENAIDAEKIAAELRNGVLQISLPKPEALKPRKIAIA